MTKLVTKSEHIQQGKKNQALAQILMNGISGYDDWVVTTTFYSALHFVESELMTVGLPAGGHHTRQKHISKCANDSRSDIDDSIYHRYRYLQDQSEQARYYCGNFTPAALAEAESILIEIRHKLSIS